VALDGGGPFWCCVARRASLSFHVVRNFQILCEEPFFRRRGVGVLVSDRGGLVEALC
jgi:hypothetical protein